MSGHVTESGSPGKESPHRGPTKAEEAIMGFYQIGEDAGIGILTKPWSGGGHSKKSSGGGHGH